MDADAPGGEPGGELPGASVHRSRSPADHIQANRESVHGSGRLATMVKSTCIESTVLVLTHSARLCGVPWSSTACECTCQLLASTRFTQTESLPAPWSPEGPGPK